MSWDTEGTKNKILEAALSEFSKYGPDGTTIEKISRISKVNKERIYNYFGTKYELFETVIYNELTKSAQSTPLVSSLDDDLSEYAGQVYDYHQQHPELSRLLLWEGLVYNEKVPNEEERRLRYLKKIRAVKSAQINGSVSNEIEAEYLAFIILTLANSWFMLPHVARMFLPLEDINNHLKRRDIIKSTVKKILNNS